MDTGCCREIGHTAVGIVCPCYWNKFEMVIAFVEKGFKTETLCEFLKEMTQISIKSIGKFDNDYLTFRIILECS